MSSREWESIIQQALQSVMEESNEHLPQLLNAFQRDLSGVGINTPVQNTAEETDENENENENTETYTQPVQTSFRNVYNAFRNTPSQTYVQDSQLLAQYFRYLYNYQDTMRMYNENMASSNRILNFMMNHGNTRRNPFRNTIPHTFEIQEFTLPFFRSSDDTRNTRPSMEQIVNTTRIFSYDPSEELITTRCPISFEDFNEGDILCEIIRCHHVFKYNHLYNWFSSNSRCPVCRHDINSEVIG